MNAEPSSTEEGVDLFLAERRAGSAGDTRAFAARYPHLAPELGAALDALIALETISGPPELGATPERPERIGSFRIVREIGRGGMGVVLEAVEEELQRRVALKLLPPELLPSSSARARFRREAELAARLDHPGIATVYGAGVAEGRPWIAMRYVEGRTLARSIADARGRGARCAQLGSATGGRAAALEVAACLAAVARALHSAHEQGVVHRDVKPSNIVVTTAGTPVLLDFGLAIALEPSAATLTRTGDTPGTPNYLAPETVSGEHAHPGAQGDVYALGVTLYECLTTKKAFEAPTIAALYRAILSAPTPSARASNRDVPPDLDVVVATAMERDRSRRYRDAAALAADLEACVAGRPIAARPVPFHGRLRRWAKREPRQAVLAGLLTVATLLAATLAGSFWASRDEVRAAERSAREQALETAIGDGFSFHSAGAPAEAGAAFRRALEIDPRCVEAQVGQILLDLDVAARADLHARIARLPADLEGRHALEALVDRRPLAPLPRGTVLEGASAFELCVHGLCWLQQANRSPVSERAPSFADAVRCFREAIPRAPVARALYHEQLAIASQLAGDESTARSVASSLLALWPDSARALYAAGRALFAFDAPPARRCLERAIELDPQRLDPYVVLAMTCWQQRDFEAAEDVCWHGLGRHPRSAYLHFWLGQSLMLRECHVDASEAFERAASLDPSHPAIWSEIANYDLFDGEVLGAERSYEHALALDPGAHRVRIFYAAALELAGDFDGAQREIDAAVAGLYPADAGYWKSAAAMLSSLGAYTASDTLADAGLCAFPDGAEPLRLPGDAAPTPR